MDQVPGGRFLFKVPGAMRRRGAASAIAALVLLGACASFDGRGLVPGKSIATEVEALMGPPAQRLSLPAGETALYFSRLPAGRAMYVATIGPDGVLRSLEQRLTRENMAKLIPGSSTMKEVRELFGPPVWPGVWTCSLGSGGSTNISTTRISTCSGCCSPTMAWCAKWSTVASWRPRAGAVAAGAAGAEADQARVTSDSRNPCTVSVRIA